MSKLGKIVGSISPLAGAITGQGLFGKLAGTGAMGLLPKMQADAKKKKRKGAADVDTTTTNQVNQMAKGGKVTRGDGCAKRGRTRGRMR